MPLNTRGVARDGDGGGEGGGGGEEDCARNARERAPPVYERSARAGLICTECAQNFHVKDLRFPAGRP